MFRICLWFGPYASDQGRNHFWKLGGSHVTKLIESDIIHMINLTYYPQPDSKGKNMLLDIEQIIEIHQFYFAKLHFLDGWIFKVTIKK